MPSIFYRHACIVHGYRRGLALREWPVEWENNMFQLGFCFRWHFFFFFLSLPREYLIKTCPPFCWNFWVCEGVSRSNFSGPSSSNNKGMIMPSLSTRECSCPLSFQNSATWWQQLWVSVSFSAGESLSSSISLMTDAFTVLNLQNLSLNIIITT